jgi:hypothetical protein
VQKVPSHQLLFLTVSERQEDVTAALDAGVRGYILKGISRSRPDPHHPDRGGGRDLYHAGIRRAAARLTAQQGKAGSRRRQPSAVEHAREQVLRELSLGLTNKNRPQAQSDREDGEALHERGVAEAQRAKSRRAVVAATKLRNHRPADPATAQRRAGWAPSFIEGPDGKKYSSKMACG